MTRAFVKIEEGVGVGDSVEFPRGRGPGEASPDLMTGGMTVRTPRAATIAGAPVGGRYHGPALMTSMSCGPRPLPVERRKVRAEPQRPRSGGPGPEAP